MSPSQTPQQAAIASRALGRWGVVASVLIAMQVGFAVIFLRPTVNEMCSSPRASDSDMLPIIAVDVLVFYLGAALTFLLWTHRAASNLRLLHPNAGFTFTPGWCVGWWFVPFANLWKPFQALHEIWHYSDPVINAEHVDVETGYTRQHAIWGKAAPQVLFTWWGAWILKLALERLFFDAVAICGTGLAFGGALSFPSGPAGDAVAVPVLLVGGVVSVAAAVLCLLVILRITAMQRESFARRATRPDVTSALGHVVGIDE